MKSKNIHVLPTNKPSMLSINCETDLLQLGLDNRMFHDDMHIYIISDEEIKEGDWVLFTSTNEVIKVPLGGFKGKVCKKIILTTDQDLIKDGVQAIDDEFLEWFVKNTSCEFVKIYYKCDKSNCYLKEWNTCCKEAKPVLTFFAENESKAKYFKEQEIIPKEEPKKIFNLPIVTNLGSALTETMKSVSQHEGGIKQGEINLPSFKQEVIKTEEDAKIFVETMENIPEPNDKLKKAFKDFKEQETLEEDAETELYITINKIIDGGKDLPKGYSVTRGQAVDYAFKIALEVAKWQQEQTKTCIVKKI